MAITLPPETTKELIGSIKRYVAENFDQDGVCFEKEFTY